MLDHLLLEITSGSAESTDNVFNEVSSVSVVHYLSEEDSRLLVVGIGVRVFISANLASHGEGGKLL